MSPKETGGEIKVNDVSRMSSSTVSRIIFPRNEKDVKEILQSAYESKKRIGIRGTKHSMGGHSIPSNAGWQIDTKFLRRVEYNPEFPNQVKCQPGATWADLISLLNKYGKAPRTMQSYCTFSVGGTLAVNAHGITTDYCLAESVLEMRLARVNTKGNAEIRTCRAPDLTTDRNTVESELFRSTIGGYGLFGIMTEVTLKVVDNVHLELDSMILSLQCPDMEEESEFVRIYDNCRGQDQHLLDGELSLASTGLGAVEIKIARMNTINLEKASLYVFRRNSDASSVSDLPVAPRELTPTSRLLYKWLLPLAKEMRYSKEEKSGEALDWNQNDMMTKNHLLYESAVPMATLYNPLVKKNDTFVLQEFFCPHDKFSEWIEQAKPIYKELEREQHKKEQEIILLNTTIRYVEKDDCTVLSYSRDEKGSFAFVLYFRIDIDEEVEKRLGVIHNKLAEITVSLGGTFYLPYRRCYSQELLEKAYPMIQDFARLKEKYDPHTLFGNPWFDKYVLLHCSKEYQVKWTLLQRQAKNRLEKTGSIMDASKFSSWLPRSDQSTLIRRSNSYRTLLRSKTMRDDFRQKFLVKIFHLADPNEVMRAMTRFAWDPKNTDDFHIYKCLFKYFNGDERGAVTKVQQNLRALEQLNQQKNELTKETVSILSKLGKVDSIHSYACFGDNGKTVHRFVKELSIDGMIYVVHDADIDKENNYMPPLTTVLERGSLNSVADKQVKFDYISDNAALKLSCIPSGSVDLITMNQGLHHIPIEKLHGFLVEVNRILSPNGVFIIREHDLEVKEGDGKVPYAMLDLAHSVFNAVTGVPLADEQKEIRAFRSISEWREIVEKVGFLDTRVYEVEEGDPTWDEMMAFVKNVDGDVESPTLQKGQVCKKNGSNEYPPMKELVATLLQQIPQSSLNFAMNVLDTLNEWLPKIENIISSKLLNGIPELIKEANLDPSVSRDIMKQVVNVIEPSIGEIIRQIQLLAKGARDMFAKAEPKEYFKFFKVGNEVFLILPYLAKKVHLNREMCSDVEIILVEFVQKKLSFLLPQEMQEENDLKSDDNMNKVEESMDENDISVEEVREMLIKLSQEIPELLDPQKLVAESGFSLMQQTAILGRIGASDIESTAQILSKYLTPEIWGGMKKHLTNVIDSRDLPTKTRLLSSSDNHPWYRVLRTFLQSPQVLLNQQATRTLKFMGLNELLVIYKQAKRDHETLRFSSSDQFTLQYLDESDRSIADLNKDWRADVVKKVITFDNGYRYCLHDVAEIIEAKFGYKSITSRKVDVTKELRNLHMQIHKNLSDGSINTTKSSDNKYHHIGFLPLDEEQLVEMRNKGDAQKELGDSLRRSLVNAATLGAAGNNQLKITYRKISVSTQVSTGSQVMSTLDRGFIENLGSLSESVCAMLEGKGIVRSDLHPLDGEWTWFKLNEWMQVEMLDELVKSLEHTPWYRFPYMGFLGTYFKVFKKQTEIVKEKYGVESAYASGAFIVDFVPAIVMSMLFAQLKMLAFPLEMTMPEDGYDHDPSRFLEEVLLHINFDDKDAIADLDSFCKSNIHPKIVKAALLSNNFALISTPPFKAMGEILKKISIQYPTARVFQISNQKEIQVRVSKSFLSNNDAKQEAKVEFERLKSLAGCKVMMDFAWPSTYFNRERNENDTHDMSGQGKTFYCLEVKCIALLDLFRLCSMLDHFEVDQVFDFWN